MALVVQRVLEPGSDNESLSAVPSEKKLLKTFEGKDIIYCADAGLGYRQ